MLKLSARDPVRYKESKVATRRLMATVGILGLLEILADIAQEFGDGVGFSPDSFWLNTAAQIDSVRERLQEEQND